MTMDRTKQIERWESRRAELAAAGDLDGAETVADHVARLRSLSGERVRDDPGRLDVAEQIERWQNRRDELQVQASDFRQCGGIHVAQRLERDARTVAQHIARLKSLG